MAPSKKDATPLAPPVLLGRFGTSLKIGIVGLPNVGKSTFFNVLTKSQVAAENYPFCTIDPNEARVPVPDERWEYLCQVHKPASKVPAFLNVVDIAGLVKGAHEGQGLGNAFLSHISACDSIFHMLRVFEDDDVTHIDGEVSPTRDAEVIFEELRLKDVENLSKRMDAIEKTVLRGAADKKVKEEYEVLCKVRQILQEEKKHLRLYKGEWNEKEIEVLNKYMFLTAKPMIYLLNLSENDFLKKKNKWLPLIKKWIQENDHPTAAAIPFSASLEAKLAEMPTDEDRQQFRKSHGLDGMNTFDKIITTGFKALNLQYFFTAGEDEVKAWTIVKGTKAPQAAGKIHTDFEKGFIMADVMRYEDFKAADGSENAVKAAGKYRQQGRNYVVEDGDIIHFKFNAGAGLKDAKKK